MWGYPSTPVLDVNQGQTHGWGIGHHAQKISLRQLFDATTNFLTQE